MSYQVDCVVIGAGVVGLAVARQLQLAGREVYLLEKERSFGMETSSRNSEVIHAGIYYSPGSLKAKLCVRGKQLMYEYCRRRNVPFKNLGKIIVAVDDAEVPVLEKYVQTARANGVDDLQWLDKDQIAQLEPDIHAVRGLLSPSTGIVDSHAYMQALLEDFELAGGTFIRKTAVARGRVLKAHQIRLQLADDENTVLDASMVVNCAGLHAPEVARRIEGMPSQSIPTPRYAVGHYFTLGGRSPFKRLIYPIARAGGLGVHVTLDMTGAARFGPDVSWRESIDYTFDSNRASAFIAAISAYYPGIRSQDLLPGYTGIRPKISGPEDPNKDFLIQDASAHGIAGVINLFGIESPGLTSSLAIAEVVSSRLMAE